MYVDAHQADLSHKGVAVIGFLQRFSLPESRLLLGEILACGPPKRIEALLSRGLITKEQAEKFQRNGAVGATWKTCSAGKVTKALIRKM